MKDGLDSEKELSYCNNEHQYASQWSSTQSYPLFLNKDKRKTEMKILSGILKDLFDNLCLVDFL